MGSLNSATRSGGGYATAPAPQRFDSLRQELQKTFIDAPLEPKQTGYGLPCAHCKTYYAADLPACPVCKSPQRVSPTAPRSTAAPAEQLPDPEQIEKERERFLNEFNAQVMVSPLPPDAPTPAHHCNRVENHGSEPVPADICQSCYDRLQERVDVLEAAMHIDLKDASQIVYDAVWADTSDPSKTYQNAAQALLSEIRRRSGIPQVFGPLQTPMN